MIAPRRVNCLPLYMLAVAAVLASSLNQTQLGTSYRPARPDISMTLSDAIVFLRGRKCSSDEDSVAHWGSVSDDTELAPLPLGTTPTTAHAQYDSNGSSVQSQSGFVGRVLGVSFFWGGGGASG